MLKKRIAKSLCSIKSKTNKNELSKEIRDEIKISLEIIKNKSKETVKSIY